MRKICLAALVLAISVFDSKSQSLFVKEYHKYKIDTTVDVVILYKSNFYCLKSNHDVFVINSKTNLIDSSYKDNSRDVKISNLYLHNDTLIGINKSNTYYLNTSTHKWIFFKTGYHIPPIYEDYKFIVNSSCSGEFGGSLYFIDKKTNIRYECRCNCAVSLLKNNGKYNVTASLAHLAGFTNVFEIEDPLKLKVYNRDYIKKKRDAAKKKHQLYVGVIGDDESNSTQGTTQLIDSVGITSATSFIYNSKIYYVVKKYKDVSIDTISNKKLIPIEDLTNSNTWNDYTQVRNCYNKPVVTFENDHDTGFIYIDDNKLTFYVFSKTLH